MVQVIFKTHKYLWHVPHVPKEKTVRYRHHQLSNNCRENQHQPPHTHGPLSKDQFYIRSSAPATEVFPKAVSLWKLWRKSPKRTISVLLRMMTLPRAHVEQPKGGPARKQTETPTHICKTDQMTGKWASKTDAMNTPAEQHPGETGNFCWTNWMLHFCSLLGHQGDHGSQQRTWLPRHSSCRCKTALKTAVHASILKKAFFKNFR